MPQAANTPPAAPAEVPVTSDYQRRVVAYVWETEPVTREELGEYLIARHGPEKLGVLLNKRLIDDVCRQQGIEVTGAEVETAVAADLPATPDRAKVLKQLLGRYKMNLHEWKEEVIRPRLQLSRLCRAQVHVGDDEIRRAFEALHGEKVQCRVIFYPGNAEGLKAAQADYGQVRDSADAFDRKARQQYLPKYAAEGGKILPLGHCQDMAPELDRALFQLRPGEVSEVVQTAEGFGIFKCVRHIPAEPITLDSVRDKLAQQVFERKVGEQLKVVMQQLREQTRPEILLKRPKPGGPPVMPEGSGPARPGQVVARYNGGQPVTREELGEYLIACYGAETLELLVNRRIIDRECARRKITVTEAEVDAGLAEDLKKLNVDERVFRKQLLNGYGKTLYEYREDAVQSRLMLAGLARDRVKVTDDELRMAFEAYYGERLECRIILWPPDQTKFALEAYPKIRDSEEAFADAAQHQASPTLAAKGGRIDRFGRHTLGDDNLEREAFRLRPGHVSTLIGTPQGNVVIKCDRRIPPDTARTIEKERASLEGEVRRKKVQVEMQVVFNELSAQAHPKLLLTNPDKPSDLASEVRKELAEVKDLKPLVPASTPPGP
jgi:parvulin-like peptidyl-prolyl isomerase